MVRDAAGQLERAVEVLDDVGTEDAALEARVVGPLPMCGAERTRGAKLSR
jgi:hypothetical protein